MKTVILKGFNNSIPPIFRYGKNINWLYEIGIDSEYDLGNEDQDDWNKLIGVKRNYFNALEHSCMIGWSWDKEKKLNRLNFYKHIEGSVEKGLTLTHVLKGEKIRVGFIQENKRCKVVLLVRNEYYETYINGNSWYLINTWFGGNRSAPNNFYTTTNRLK